MYLATVLHTIHSTTIASRFSPGSRNHPQFEILYLAVDPIVALFEVGAMLGTRHGPHVPNASVFFAVASVEVRLQSVADLTNPKELQHLRTTVQELTGDWQCYRLRNPIAAPVLPYHSDVPTQQLGYELYHNPSLEGFRTYSAKGTTHENLVVFPDKLAAVSEIICKDPHTGTVIGRIPRRPKPRQKTKKVP